MAFRPRNSPGQASGPVHLRFALLLLGLSTSVPVLVGWGCGYGDYLDFVYSVLIGGLNALQRPTSPSVSGTSGPVSPGAPVMRNYGLNQSHPVPPAAERAAGRQTALAGTATISYWPPTGAIAPYFTGMQPDNPSGPPPFVFTGVPTGVPSAVQVSYGAPLLPKNRGRFDVADMLTVVEESGNATTVLKYTSVVADPPLTVGSAASEASLRENAVHRTSAATEWFVGEFYYGIPEVAMTTELCAQVNDYFRDGSVFFALRLPLSDEEPTVPIPMNYADADGFPRIDLLDETDWPATAVTSMPLEIAHDRLEWAENTLPAREGEHWVTLAAAPGALPTCPGGLSLQYWEYYAWLPLDPGQDAAAWSDRVIPGYVCFVGDTLPPYLVGDEAQQGAAAAHATAESPRITPLGPMPIRLIGDPPDPPFSVHSAALRGAKPGSQVKMLFVVENLTAQAASATLSLKHRLNIPWQAYNGDFVAPNLGSPISGPIAISAHNSVPVWVVAAVPAGVGGAETVTLTATSLADGHADWGTGALWVGGFPHDANIVRRHRGHL